MSTPIGFFSIFWYPLDASWVAIYSAYPLVSGFGKTPEQALAELKVALKTIREIEQQDGMSYTSP